MAKTAEDAAFILEAIAGEDEKDATSSSKPVDKYSECVRNFDMKKIRIGIPEEYFVEGLDPEIEKKLKEAIAELEKSGAEILKINLPHTKYAVPTYYIITPSEVSSNLARFDGIRFGYSAAKDIQAEVKNINDVYLKSKGQGFGAEAKRRIMIGTYALSSGYHDAYYLKAQKVRALIKKDFDAVFEKVDAIVTPTAPSVAFKIGEHNDNPLEMYLGDIFLSAVSLAGLPAISVPCGFVKPKDGDKEMPVGMQIIGKPFDEKMILEIADTYEKKAGWLEKHPKL